MDNSRTIIPIASGKGGVGKSLITANLGYQLAQRNKQVILIDLDLGGSNLHTMLGQNNNQSGIGDFVRVKGTQLKDHIVSIDENLSYIPGDAKSPMMANLNYSQKIKLIDQIRKLDADYILLDLGAGSSFNTLDFYGIGAPGLLVTTTEYPAMMNLLTFLKNYSFRILDRNFSKNHRVKLLLKKFFEQAFEENHFTMDQFLAELDAVDSFAARAANKLCVNTHHRIVFNKVNHADELSAFHNIKSSSQKILNFNIEAFGVVFRDREIEQSTCQMGLASKKLADNPGIAELTTIADRIIRKWLDPIENSGALLLKNAEHLYQQRQ